MNANQHISLRIAIIGGGFSGACLAAELLRAGDPSLSVTLIERGPSPGRGVAYGTHCAGHLLNVPAQKMSALASDASHFLRWAQRHHDHHVQPGDFLPRRVYGRYVESVLREAIEGSASRFECRREEAISLTWRGDQAEISLHGGERILADKVVFALGNFAPANPRIPGLTETSSRYVSNPWQENALANIELGNIENEQSILLIGSGLTSVDVAISLRERGFSGKIHTLSRHGLLPQMHQATQPWQAFCDDASPRTARELFHSIRVQVRTAEEQGSGWRAVIDSLRPVTQKIWRSLPPAEQRRFLRHLRAYWDVHRHRVAPQIGAQLAAEMSTGSLQVHAGRILEYCEGASGVYVTYRRRGNGESNTLHVDRVINCTGPDSDFRRVHSPLLNDLLRKKLARTDSLFLGLDTTEEGALVDASGAVSDFVYAIGPLRKGNLWESTAVPEIRVQAAALAEELMRSGKRPCVQTVPVERPAA